MKKMMLDTSCAIHSTKLSGNFGPKLNGSVQSNRRSFKKTGPPFFKVDNFSQSDRSNAPTNVNPMGGGGGGSAGKGGDLMPETIPLSGF